MNEKTQNQDVIPLEGEAKAALEAMKESRTVGRIWQIDHTVWSEDPAEITNRLGWLHAPVEMQGNLEEVGRFVEEVREAGYTAALLLGMGGSSLAPEVFRETFGVAPGFLDLQVLDSTDPGAVAAHAARLDYRRTLFIVSTKSGGTAETLSFFKYFFNQVSQEVGIDRAGEHFTAITDPGSRLVAMAEKFGFRRTFLNDPDIGGRYSVLSYFGLVPAGLVGVDLKELLRRAVSEARRTRDGGEESAAARIGAMIGAGARLGRDKLTFVISPRIKSFGDWVEQLIAESTGKQGTGILPVVTEPVGPPEVYGPDRTFVYLRLQGDGGPDGAVAALEGAGHRVIRLHLADLYDLGGQYFLWEMATAVAGHVLGVNPFDQPNVEDAKVIAREMIRRYQETGALPESEFSPPSLGALQAFLAKSSPGDYIAVHAYVPPNAGTDELLRELSAHLRAQYRLAVTTGYGPRFLHSTGQLHKGDGGGGLFVQITSDAENDIPIPDEAGAEGSGISFGVLELAQAIGDGQALREAGRRVIRFHLGTDIAGGLKQLSR